MIPEGIAHTNLKKIRKQSGCPAYFLCGLQQTMQRFFDAGIVQAPDSEKISMPDAAGCGVRGKQGK